MPDYTPPPSDLRRLNPIQRYLQKGQLDRQDWLRLGALVLLYFIVRPYLQKGAKWLFAPKEGEAQQKAYQQRRAKAKIGANAIRGTAKNDGQLADLDEGDNSEDDTAVVSGSKVQDKSDTINRKKSRKVAFQSEQEKEKLLNWEDEPVEASAAGEQTDVMKWLDKWDK